MNKETILAELRKHHEELAAFGITKIGLFGSYLHQEATESSDIDLLVTFSRYTFDDYMGSKLFLETLFNKKVDLVIERSLKPRVQYVTKEAVYA